MGSTKFNISQANSKTLDKRADQNKQLAGIILNLSVSGGGATAIPIERAFPKVGIDGPNMDAEVDSPIPMECGGPYDKA